MVNLVVSFWNALVFTPRDDVTRLNVCDESFARDTPITGYVLVDLFRLLFWTHVKANGRERRLTFPSFIYLFICLFTFFHFLPPSLFFFFFDYIHTSEIFFFPSFYLLSFLANLDKISI